ncbi:hypothetical protein P3T66_06680 [Latilactobacillus sakei]|nr:hypothetical protein [Latilactobacillus sakei]WEY49786.1 hypothetical protein P3T66_06680 [Latilactobacillus sakei]
METTTNRIVAKNATVAKMEIVQKQIKSKNADISSYTDVIKSKSK